jgi:hypothetical protein
MQYSGSQISYAVDKNVCLFITKHSSANGSWSEENKHFFLPHFGLMRTLKSTQPASLHSLSWDTDSRSASQQIFHLWNPKVHYRVHNSPPNPRLCVTLRNMQVFHDEWLLIPQPTTKSEEWPLLAAYDSLFNIFEKPRKAIDTVHSSNTEWNVLGRTGSRKDLQLFLFSYYVLELDINYCVYIFFVHWPLFKSPPPPLPSLWLRFMLSNNAKPTNKSQWIITWDVLIQRSRGTSWFIYFPRKSNLTRGN